jgi:CheY-like chemotaxis protein
MTSTGTVMIVDDNAATRRMVKNALARHGYRVVEAADGATARKLMVSEHPRVVLQDLVLPDTDGFTLVGELRKLSTTDVTILAFSGFVSKLDEARISAVGFDYIIPKPIAPSALVPLVEAHFPAPAATSERFGQGRRVVVADDDPLQLKLASFRLGRLGFEIETVPDGAAALAAIRRRRPDAVVSDVMMPELDGFGLAMALRQDPELASLPLVLVTSSYVEPSDRELAKRAGANELVVRTPELAEVIEHLRTTLSSSAPATTMEAAAVPELERERNRRVFRQLERQVLLNTGLAKRCSALASEDRYRRRRAQAARYRYRPRRRARDVLRRRWPLGRRALLARRARHLERARRRQRWIAVAAAGPSHVLRPRGPARARDQGELGALRPVA